MLSNFFEIFLNFSVNFWIDDRFLSVLMNLLW